MQSKEKDTSVLVHLGEREIQVQKTDRRENEASHVLASLGRASKRTQLWVRSYPAEIHVNIRNDCNMPVI
jgi:hypothetical protein